MAEIKEQDIVAVFVTYQEEPIVGKYIGIVDPVGTCCVDASYRFNADRHLIANHKIKEIIKLTRGFCTPCCSSYYYDETTKPFHTIFLGCSCGTFESIYDKY